MPWKPCSANVSTIEAALATMQNADASLNTKIDDLTQKFNSESIYELVDSESPLHSTVNHYINLSTICICRYRPRIYWFLCNRHIKKLIRLCIGAKRRC